MDPNSFMNYQGYRSMIIEDKIEECMEAARQGATEISIDRGDLTDSEFRYLQAEVQRRIEGGGL